MEYIPAYQMEGQKLPDDFANSIEFLPRYATTAVSCARELRNIIAKTKQSPHMNALLEASARSLLEMAEAALLVDNKHRHEKNKIISASVRDRAALAARHVQSESMHGVPAGRRKIVASRAKPVASQVPAATTRKRGAATPGTRGRKRVVVEPPKPMAEVVPEPLSLRTIAPSRETDWSYVFAGSK